MAAHLRRVTTTIGVAVMLVVQLHAVAPAQGAFPGANGKIAFFSGAEQEIFAVDPDVGSFTQLTDDRGSSVDPAWSADGRRIAFSYGESLPLGSEIYVVNADGSGKVRVTNNQFIFDARPTWSPDGRSIAFDQTNRCEPGRCLVNIQVVDLAGTGERTVCCGTNYAGDPSWSPDGSQIAFVRSSDPFNGPLELWTVRPDGSPAVRVCCDGRNIAGPDWAPDGSSILFLSRSMVMSVRPDGSDVKTIYTPPAGFRVLDAAWSPDGTKIVLSQDSPSEANSRLYVINADGSNAHRITDPQGQFGGHRFPSWQPIPGPQRGDYKNASKYCKALRVFLGDMKFSMRYENHGKCVSKNQ